MVCVAVFAADCTYFSTFFLLFFTFYFWFFANFPALFLPEFGLFFSLALLCCSVLFPEIKVILLQQRCCMFMHACVSLLTDCWES